MADVHETHDNGAAGAPKRKPAADADMAPAGGLLKRARLEPPEANPNTMRAVCEKNRALALELREKNRRAAFLTAKCEALFRGRALANASLRCVRRQWLQLLDDLTAALSVRSGAATTAATNAEGGEWTDVLDAAENFGLLRTPAAELRLNLPEWFLAVTQADVENEAESAAADAGERAGRAAVADDPTQYVAAEDLSDTEQQLQEQLTSTHTRAQRLLADILSAVAAEQPPEAKLELAQLAAAKRAAVAHALALKDQVQTYKARVQELETDLLAKEVERHRACRELDRLSHFVEQSPSTLVDPSEQQRADGDAKSGGAGDERQDASDAAPVKTEAPAAAVGAVTITEEELALKEKTLATLRENQTILSTKLYRERGVCAELKKEVEKLRAMETARRKEEATMKQEFEDKLEHLRDEKTHISEEFSKIRHKAKDIEAHVNEKWKKKLARLQTDMTKVKTQMDELNLKNVALREKLSNASALKDQLNELKSRSQLLQSENETLKSQVSSARQKSERADVLTESKQLAALTQQVQLLEASKLELQKSYDALKTSEGDKVASLLARQSELDATLAAELRAHAASKAAADALRLEIEAMRGAEAASREENDALISEIDTLSKELETARQGRKKLLHQVDEKRSSNKKLHSQLSKEEQAKAHCFEELAAARLQVSSLGTVHKQQKAYIESVKEALHAKEKELEALKAFVATIASEKDAAEAEKRKAAREAEVAKHLYATSAAETAQKQQQEQQRACDRCDEFKKKEKRYEKLLQQAAGAGNGTGAGSGAAANTGELSDLERFELAELQKLVKCSVCQDQRKNVLLAKCFHMFCRDCVDSNLKSRNRKCPTCKKMFGQDDVKAVWFT
ncbi:hypothetical protein PybrP1_007116 [[Pythium] brassicae (nom. inval.)]|nr:hypothetical protein PybrP1_007116 [[Pythium] brassicae (nom. inval.)]